MPRKKKAIAPRYRGKILSEEDDQWVSLVMAGAFAPEGVTYRPLRRRPRRKTRLQARRGARRRRERLQARREERREKRRETRRQTAS